MASVQSSLPEPGRQETEPAQLALRSNALGSVHREQLCRDLPGACVGVSPARPFLADGQAVGRKRLLVTSPHADGRMVTPPVPGDVHRSHDLQGFHALFSEAPRIQGPGAPRKVWVWEKGLHNVSFTESSSGAPAPTAVRRDSKIPLATRSRGKPTLARTFEVLCDA